MNAENELGTTTTMTTTTQCFTCRPICVGNWPLLAH